MKLLNVGFTELEGWVNEFQSLTILKKKVRCPTAVLYKGICNTDQGVPRNVRLNIERH